MNADVLFTADDGSAAALAPFQCGVCRKRFKHKGDRRQHMRDKHGELRPINRLAEQTP